MELRVNRVCKKGKHTSCSIYSVQIDLDWIAANTNPLHWFKAVGVKAYQSLFWYVFNQDA